MKKSASSQIDRVRLEATDEIKECRQKLERELASQKEEMEAQKSSMARSRLATQSALESKKEELRLGMRGREASRPAEEDAGEEGH